MNESLAFLFPAEEEKAGNAPRSPHIALDPENVKKGLGQLVLTLVELIRRLLEKQALRRIEGGSLTEQEVERLGLTFLELHEQMKRLKQEFGLTDEDLNPDLGPLGKLL
ncbi:MAG: gas vesicle protein K [Chitinivibrionia bacterium]|nr:gas vesicle protein K [Chitinivibrionia bacterium]